MTRQSSSMGHRCRQLCTNANFTAFGSRRTAWPFLALPSPPGAHGSQGEDVHSHAPNLPAAQPSGQQADVAIPTCPASIYRHLAATVADRAACCRNCRKRETGGRRLGITAIGAQIAIVRQKSAQALPILGGQILVQRAALRRLRQQFGYPAPHVQGQPPFRQGVAAVAVPGIEQAS